MIEVLSALLCQHKKDRLQGQVKHKQAIGAEYMAKLATYFEDVSTASSLQKLTQFCWFAITIQFCLRDHEIQCNL